MVLCGYPATTMASAIHITNFDCDNNLLCVHNYCYYLSTNFSWLDSVIFTRQFSFELTKARKSRRFEIERTIINVTINIISENNSKRDETKREWRNEKKNYTWLSKGSQITIEMINRMLPKIIIYNETNKSEREINDVCTKQ